MPRRRAKDRRHTAAARSAASPESGGDSPRQPAVDLAHAGSPRTQLAREAAATNSDVDAELWEVLTIRGCPGCLRTRGCLRRNSIARVWEACYDVISSNRSSSTSSSIPALTVWLPAQVLEICEDAELEEIHSILYGALSLAVGNPC